jgi:hypothetical protein
MFRRRSAPIERRARPAQSSRLALAVILAALTAAALPALGSFASPACAQAGSRDADRGADPPREGGLVRVGGCRTSEREYGLPALADSAEQAALAELLAPGEGVKAGPACGRLAVDTPLFAQVGSVAPLEDAEWVAAVQILGARMDSCGLVHAERSLLAHTTGPCFPPYHVDLRACGTEAQVARFLDGLAAGPWGRFEPTDDRSQRRLFICAGRNLSLMDSVVDLR